MGSALTKTLKQLACSLSLLGGLLSSGRAMAQEELVTRLYLDIAGRRPSVAEQAIVQNLKAADSPAQYRAILRSLLLEVLLKDPTFESRLRFYFNGLFATNDTHGLILPACLDVANTAPCVSVGAQADFRDEPAMLLARLITQGSPDGFDIRQSLTTPYTLMTRDMARSLDDDAVLKKLALGNIDREKLSAITQQSDSSQWTWIKRDTSNTGLPAGGDGSNHMEKHAGVLTTPAYLLRSTSHLARANNFYQWFMCRTLEQSPVEESAQLKLVERRPCAGCHTLLEPLGSFWVYWRPKINSSVVAQDWLLDGVKRSITQNNAVLPAANDGTVPLDVDDPNSAHSRSAQGTFRGQSGKGPLALGQIGVKDPEFARCMVRHAWQLLLGRSMAPEESGWAYVLAERLAKDYAWDMREIFIDIVLNGAYANK